MSLGPQCLRCQKRRVKCDSRKPRCTKCTVDEIECPGYTKGCKFVAMHPQINQKARRRKRTTTAMPAAMSEDFETSTATRSEVKCTLHLAEGKSNTGTTSLDFVVPRLDDQFIATVEFIQCFIRDITPDLSAVYWKTQNAITLRDWIHVPPMVKNMLTTSVLATRVLMNNVSPTEMYKYRGKVLADLHRYVQQPERQTLETSVACLMSVLEQEVHLSPFMGFKMHLDAAHKIVKKCGGVEKCLQLWPESQPPEMLLFFVQADVVSTTTTSTSSMIMENVARQRHHSRAFENFEANLLDSAFPCPLALFEILARINEFRASSAAPGAESISWQDSFLQLLSDTQAFNAHEWANGLDCLPEISLLEPVLISARDQWTAMARCFQSATLIYLIRSTIDTDLYLSATQRAQLKVIAIETAKWAQNQLQCDLRQLFKSYPGTKATCKNPLLWKFCVWPLTMLAYETVAQRDTASGSSLVLGRSVLHQDSEEDTLFAQLEQIGVRLGSCSLTAGATIFERVSKSDREIKWDDFFARSCCFLL